MPFFYVVSAIDRYLSSESSVVQQAQYPLSESGWTVSHEKVGAILDCQDCLRWIVAHDLKLQLRSPGS